MAAPSARSSASPTAYSRDRVLSAFSKLFRQSESTRRLPPSFAAYRDDATAASWSTSLEYLLPLRSLLDLNSSMNQRAKGKYLKGKIVTPVFHLLALYLVLETDDGLCVPVVLYNYVPLSPTCSLEQCQDLLPQGATLIIREPYSKLYPEDNVLIRVDNPGDVSVERPVSGAGESAQTLRERGNECLKAQAHNEAVALYSHSLAAAHRHSTDADAVLALSNRAEALLKLGRFRQAMQDCLEALDLDKDHVKSRLRLVRAYEGLQLHAEAVNQAQSLLRQSLSSDLVERLERTVQTQQELAFQHSSGQVDWAKYLFGQAGSPQPPLADFVGPIAVVRIPGKGCGLVTTRRVSQGELLLVENPFCHAQVSTDQIDPSVSSASERADMAQLASRLCRMALDDPCCLVPLYMLEDQSSASASRQPNIDSFTRPDEWSQPSMLDVTKIKRIACFNAVGYRGKSLLFLVRSFFNHACLCNTISLPLGKASVIRAARDLDAGEELTISYLEPGLPLSERQTMLSKVWGFACTCELCEFEKNLPGWDAFYTDEMAVFAKLKRLLLAEPRKKTKAAWQELCANFEQLIHQVDVFAATTARPVYIHAAFWELFVAHRECLDQQGFSPQLLAARQRADQVLQVSRPSSFRHCCELAVHLAAATMQAGGQAEARAALEAALLIGYGSASERLVDRYLECVKRGEEAAWHVWLSSR